jgi:SAM-dependent methyltransferase
VPDAIFARPRLAAVYDAFDGHRDDLDSYLALAEEVAADVVLDVGCGTGSLAVLLAARGRTVVAVDPAEASLSIAKAKDRAAKVRWIHGDATALPPLNADLAVMTGNVAQVFLTAMSGNTPSAASVRRSGPAGTWHSRPGGLSTGPGGSGRQTPPRSPWMSPGPGW